MTALGNYLQADHHLTVERPYAVMVYRDIPPRAVPVPDIHYDFHLGVLLKGRYRVTYADSSCDNVPGQVWWTGCWEPHAGAALEEGTSVMLITLSPKALGNIDTFGEVSWAGPFLVPPPRRPQASRRAEQEAVLRMAAELSALGARPSEVRLRAWLKIHELILFLCQGWAPTRRGGLVGRGDFVRVLPAVERVRAEGTGVSLGEAARACGLSRSRFSEIFRAVFGDSFGKFELRARLSGAMRELRGTAKPVKAIGPDWGFADNAHFAHAFKRQFGVSPSAYRAQARRNHPTDSGGTVGPPLDDSIKSGF